MGTDAAPGYAPGVQRHGSTGLIVAEHEPSLTTPPGARTHRNVAEPAFAKNAPGLMVGDGEVASPDLHVLDFGDYLVVIGALPPAAGKALRLTHVEAGADPNGDGTVWWPKEAPDA